MNPSLADDDEYELLPKEEIDNLKKEIERLKKSPFGEAKEAENLLDAINNLNANIRKLIEIFTNAQAELESHYLESGSPAEDLKDIKEQNEQIAQGILAVADMVKETNEKIEKQGLSTGDISHQPRIPIPKPSLSTHYTSGINEMGGLGGIEPTPPEPFPEEPGTNIPPPPSQAGTTPGDTGFDTRIPEPRRRGLFRR